MLGYSAIAATIRRIPKGKVSTYGAVAKAAGFPRGARLVARTLHGAYDLPWQRVLGAGGEIKLRGESALEQRFRLQAEGITFRGRKVNMKLHEFAFNKKSRKKAVAGKRRLQESAKTPSSEPKLSSARRKRSLPLSS